MAVDKTTIKDILNAINDLRGKNTDSDEYAGANDALATILQSRAGQGGGGMPLPPSTEDNPIEVDIEIDPNLEQPEAPLNVPKDNSNEPKQKVKVTIDDPENLYKSQNSGSGGENDSQIDADIEIRDEKAAEEHKRREAVLDRISSMLDKAGQDIDNAEASGEKSEQDIKDMKDALSRAKDLLKNLSDALDNGDTDGLTADQFDKLAGQILKAAKDVANAIEKKNDYKATVQKVGKWGADELSDIETEEGEIALVKNKGTGGGIHSLEAEVDALRKKAKEMKQQQFPGIDALKLDMVKTIGNEVKEVKRKEASWLAMDRHEDPLAIRKGIKKTHQRQLKKPVVDVYLDRSGSWGWYEKKVALECLKDISQFQDRGLIKINLFYFADRVGETDSGLGSSTEAWDKIIDNIQKTGATNVLVISDSDIEDRRRGGQSNMTKHPPIKVQGKVWYLWKNGSYAVAPLVYLTGALGTSCYNLATD